MSATTAIAPIQSRIGLLHVEATSGLSGMPKQAVREVIQFLACAWQSSAVEMLHNSPLTASPVYTCCLEVLCKRFTQLCSLIALPL